MYDVLTSTSKQWVMALPMGHRTLVSDLWFSQVCTQRAPHFRRCGTVAKMSGLILWLKSHCHAAPGLSLDNGMPSKFSSFGQEIVVLLFSQKSQGDFFYDVSRDQMIAFPLRLWISNAPTIKLQTLSRQRTRQVRLLSLSEFSVFWMRTKNQVLSFSDKSDPIIIIGSVALQLGNLSRHDSLRH